MNTVTISGATLQVEPCGLDKVWTFTRRLDIPLAHVRGATFDPGANAEPKGVRRPGLAVPGKWAGTFVHNGSRSFWNVSRPGDTVVITLADERFAQLVLSVDEPRELVDRINAAVV